MDEKDKDELSQAAEYIRANTRPVLIFIENLADIASNIDMMTEMLLDGLLKSIWQYNIRAIAFFEPKDETRCTDSVLYSGYPLSGDVLLFGGRFDKQSMCVLPMDPEKARSFCSTTYL